MLLAQTARGILSGDIGATFQDKIEAYKFYNDNFMLGELTPSQTEEFRTLVEGGIIEVPAFQS
jgi:hypothetical protein